MEARMFPKSLVLIATMGLGGIAWADDGDGDGFDAVDDCDDADAAVFPGATELCNGADDDCDTLADEDKQRWFLDKDGDGYGVAALFVDVCLGNTPAPAANGTWTLQAGDCFDSSSAISPGLEEVCDGLDNDCNGYINDGIEARAWYPDDDGDGFGDPDEDRTVVAPCAPAMHVANLDDCDDERPGVRPGGLEACDGLDNDCDGEVDVGAPDGRTWHRDLDGDGFGAALDTAQSCLAPDGYVADASDCDDEADDVSPDGVEQCDAVDNDCNGVVDEASAKDAGVWWLDEDEDGLPGTEEGVRACEAPLDGSWVLEVDGLQLDCDDGDGQVGLCDDGGCNGTGTSTAPWLVSAMILLGVRRRSAAA